MGELETVLEDGECVGELEKKWDDWRMCGRNGKLVVENVWHD